MKKKKQLNGHVKPQQKRNKIHKFTHTRTHRHAHTNTQTEKQHTHFDASYENAEFDTILRTWRANKFKMHIIVVKKSNFDEVKEEIRRIRKKHT